jgi:hypothetical protein
MMNWLTWLTTSYCYYFLIYGWIVLEGMNAGVMICSYTKPGCDVGIAAFRNRAASYNSNAVGQVAGCQSV